MRIAIISVMERELGRTTMTKTISFAVMHFSIAFSVAWLLTGDVLIGGALALIEPAINTVAYYFHDRLWERLRAPRLA